MPFWLDELVKKSRIPYPRFFGLIAVLLYVLGVFFAITTDNLHRFLAEPRWILVVAFGALNGILIIFAYRKFDSSLGEVRPLIALGDIQFNELRERLLALIVNRFYWVIALSWLTLNFAHAPWSRMWWWDYNSSSIVTIYDLIATFPCCLLGGISLFMFPVGFNLAYRKLCLRTPFRTELVLSRWRRAFGGFRDLITLTLLGLVIYALFPISIWGSSPTSQTADWTIYILTASWRSPWPPSPWSHTTTSTGFSPRYGMPGSKP